MAEFARRNIIFTAVKVNEDCNVMIKVMQDSYASVNGRNMVLSDLARVCSTKSGAEVTKAFVKETSYILRAALGGGAPGAAAAPKQGPALWDTK
jgi:hypothetical protein